MSSHTCAGFAGGWVALSMSEMSSMVRGAFLARDPGRSGAREAAAAPPPAYPTPPLPMPPCVPPPATPAAPVAAALSGPDADVRRL